MEMRARVPMLMSRGYDLSGSQSPHVREVEVQPPSLSLTPDRSTMASSLTW